MSPRRWVGDLVLGARMAFAGGRDGVVRTGLGAVGVSIGVVLLLLAASIPALLDARHERAVRRAEGSYAEPTKTPPSAHTVLIARIDDEYRGRPIRGRLVRADGAQPVVPPGVTALPGPGDMVVSPGLSSLLASPDGALLRERLGYRIVGVIGERGLLDPGELAYYAGSDRLTPDQASRADYFGVPYTPEGLDPILALLVLVIFVILLLPIGIFVATAVRFGSEHRDRRLAAVRLLGADGGMARRIAAGEALLTAGVGLLLGGLFFLVGRQFIGRFTLEQLSAFPGDVRPSLPVTGLIVVAVPVAAVAVTLLALRRVVIEPLGVVRHAATARRRVWWRILLPAAGLALLFPLVGAQVDSGDTAYAARLVAGMILLLVGVTALLPWLVERTVRLLGGGFGRGVAWQLAVRRLQLDNTTSVRAVNGIAVAAAGAIALQMFFFGIDDNYSHPTGEDPSRAQALVGLFARATFDPHFDEAVRTVRGVSPVVTMTSSAVAPASRPNEQLPLTVAGCADLAQLVVVDRCADGDVFFVPPPDDGWWTDPAPGTDAVLGDDGVHWRIPAARKVTGRAAPGGGEGFGLFATPSAIAFGDTHVRRTTLLRVDAATPDVLEHLRNAAARVDPLADVQRLTAIQEAGRFRDVRRGLFAGTVVTLVLIGASLLVTAVEQLRDRRRLLAALAAFGTSRATLGWSVLWQTAVPVALGLVLAVGTGLGLGSVLLRMTEQPIVVNWSAVAGIAAIAGLVVLAVTALTLPVLWRLVRPAGLRTE